MKTKKTSLSNELLALRRYLPSKEDFGTMDYWQGDTESNKGIYVDLGAVMGNVEKAVKELKAGLFGGKKPLEDNMAIDLIDKIFGEKLT